MHGAYEIQKNELAILEVAGDINVISNEFQTIFNLLIL